MVLRAGSGAVTGADTVPVLTEPTLHSSNSARNFQMNEYRLLVHLPTELANSQIFVWAKTVGK